MTLGLKRGFEYYVLLAVASLLLVITSYSVVAQSSQGYCANPFLSQNTLICNSAESIQQNICCPDATTIEGSRYGSPNGPTNQQDCQNNYFKTDFADLTPKCDLGCCYTPTAGCSREREYTQVMCKVRDATAIFASQCSGISECALKCCTYLRDGALINVSMAVGQCSEIPGATISSRLADGTCTPPSISGGPGVTECSDGVDNDHDGFVDAQDVGCKDASGTYQSADGSEREPRLVCDDGIDNDGDTKIDYKADGSGDSGCCRADTPREDLCELSLCTAGRIPSLASGTCNCINYRSGTPISYLTQGVLCNTGQYCCSGTCQNVACTPTTCSEGDQKPDRIDAQGCTVMKVCRNNVWADGATVCPQQPEMCNDGRDNNNNGQIDCMEPSCYKVQCDIQVPPATFSDTKCQQRGYIEAQNPTIKLCCNEALRDCDQTTPRAETCGPCDCTRLGQQASPVITSIRRERGIHGLEINWQLRCNVPMQLWRCQGSQAQCSSSGSWATLGDASATATRFPDNGVAEKTNYCYKVSADYSPTGPSQIESAIVCASSGDEFCMATTDREFCMFPSTSGPQPDQPAVGVRRTIRALCTSDNSVSEIETCSGNNICIGPYNGVTQCVHQSVCAECGDPFGMFAILQGSRASKAYSQRNAYPALCKDLTATCYFDYAKSIKNNFFECGQVSTCYDYTSQQACVGDDGLNKCLTRACQWVVKPNTLSGGYCAEQPTSRYRKCEYCSQSEHNAIFDTCTQEKCLTFNEGECFYGRNLGTLQGRACKSKENILCLDYTTSTDCQGQGDGVQYNVEYDETGKRISGDNTLLTPSQDALTPPLGKCYWDTMLNGCFKDGNGDRCPDGRSPQCKELSPLGDSAQQDLTPPQTTLQPPFKMKFVNITLVVADATVPGQIATGPYQTFMCIADENPACYPTEQVGFNQVKYTRILGLGQGIHTLRVYSQDQALNIEPVKQFQIDVDRKPPVIMVTYSVTPDPATGLSSVLFDIRTDEDVVCSDLLEGQLGSKISTYQGSAYQVQYTGLQDGVYFYKVTCNDVLNNTGIAYTKVRVNADNTIFDTQPFGVIDRLPAELKISTYNNFGTCKFDRKRAAAPQYNQMQSVFDGPVAYTAGDRTYYLYAKGHSDIRQDGTYSFDVGCMVGSTPKYDEIQFVYDTTPPQTVMYDAVGNVFNTTSFYRNLDQEIYLSCQDTPEFGFGCNSTRYCLTTQVYCDPQQAAQSVLSDPLVPLRINMTEQVDMTLCYQSTENVVDAMNTGLTITYGGAVEHVQCHTLHQDNAPPTIRLAYPRLDTNPVLVSENPLVISGDVDDPDAVSTVPHNTLKIVVTRQDTGYVANFTLDANTRFEKDIVVGAPNTRTHVDMIATDRSGASSAMMSFDLQLVEMNDSLIQLVNPVGYYIENTLFGIGSNQSFDVELATHYSSECVLSYENLQTLIPQVGFGNGLQGSVLWFQAVGNGKQHVLQYHHPSPQPNQPVPVYVACKRNLNDLNDVIDYQSFYLSWDTRSPELTRLELDNSDGKDPPTIVEPQLPTHILAQTTLPTQCKYSVNRNEEFVNMQVFAGEEHQLSYAHSLDLKNGTTTGTNPLQDNTHYQYFVQCISGSGSLTEKQSLSFDVNSSKFTGIKLLSPPRYTANSTITLRLSTSKTSQQCTYGITPQTNQSMTADSTKKLHTSQPLTLAPGSYTYYFTCLFAREGPVTDYFNITIDTTPPLLVRIEDGNYSLTTQSLSANWEFRDNESGVDSYLYSVGSTLGSVDVVNWTNTTNADATAQNLNLTVLQTYYWNVKAKNRAELWSTALSSDGVTVDPSRTPNDTNMRLVAPCQNDVKDGNESDVDCGGECDACGFGKRCSQDHDCFSSNCQQGTCQEATCQDNLKNQHESDVDCGGECNRCVVGKECNHDNENCVSGYCRDNICQESSCSDGLRNGGEEGVDCGGECERSCFTERLPSCSDGIQNQNETGIDCGEPCEECKEEGPQATPWYLYVLIILGVTLIGGSVGYYFYQKFYKAHMPPDELKGMSQQQIKQAQARAQQRPFTKSFSQKQKQAGVKAAQQSGQPFEATPEQLAQLRREKESSREKEREDLFSKFEEGKIEVPEEEPGKELKPGEKLKLREFEIGEKPKKKK